jgi:putative transposase
MIATEELAASTSISLACRAFGVSRSTVHRRRRPARPIPAPASVPKPTSHRALSDTECQQVLDVLHTRFVDKSPQVAWATLLDEGEYLCSWRSMYRILAADEEVRERRNQRRHPEYKRPELLATAPNQLWSWDLTKLRGPHKGDSYWLYVIIDVFSRYVVGWMLAHSESGELAERLIRESCTKQGVERDQLTVHADRGAAPASKTVADLLRDLGVERSHSRPRVSNDNPYSEAQFKTLKYCPEFPDRFDSYADALDFCRRFFDDYNNNHRHSGIAYLTPACVHAGKADEVTAVRRRALERAYATHPERFVNGPPAPLALPCEVWINKPEDKTRVELDCPVPVVDGAQQNEAGPESPAPSVLSPERRSGCSSAEPYLPARRSNHTSSSPTGNSANQSHPDVHQAENLGGRGAAPPATQIDTRAGGARH